MNNELATGSLTPNATGPRTAAGKRRSRRNSTKHGIFAERAFLLEGESAVEFQSLRQDLRDYFNPVGAMEDVYVEKLATLFWRDRRVTYAETAETSKTIELLALRSAQRQAYPPHALQEASISNGLLGKANPLVLENAIELLEALRRDFEKRGFDKEADLSILHKIYGFFVLTEDFPELYISLAVLAGDPAECKKRSVKPEQIRLQAIEAIDDEIKRLSTLKVSIEAVESKLLEYTLGAMVVPPPEIQENLTRYEVHIARQIARHLDQLERLQCRRLGLPQAPTIKVSRG
jgi:hypothetical protein